MLGFGYVCTALELDLKLDERRLVAVVVIKDRRALYLQDTYLANPVRYFVGLCAVLETKNGFEIICKSAIVCW